MKTTKKILNNNNGVTILEMLISIALFAVVIISATQIFVLVLNGQKKAIASRNVQENMRYAFDAMAKELRMARIDSGQCNDTAVNRDVDDKKIYDDDGSGEYLKFKNYHNECVKYSLESGRIKIERDSNSGFITPDDILVSNLEFIVTDDYPTTQSAVNMKMDIETLNKKTINMKRMKMQTTITSRYY